MFGLKSIMDKPRGDIMSQYGTNKNRGFGKPWGRKPTQLKKMTVSLTMSGADAYVEQKVDTNGNENTFQAMLIHKILVHWPIEESDNGGYIIIQLNMRSSTAVLDKIDNDRVLESKWINVGTVAQGMVRSVNPDDILEKRGKLCFGTAQFYLCMDGNTGDAEDIDVDILYEDVILTERAWNNSF